jgi:hypothetical protein
MADLVPPRLRGAVLYRDRWDINHLGPFEDEYVWFPLLVAEHHGNRPEAEDAWQRAERPVEFTEFDQ